MVHLSGLGCDVKYAYVLYEVGEGLLKYQLDMRFSVVAGNKIQHKSVVNCVSLGLNPYSIKVEEVI